MTAHDEFTLYDLRVEVVAKIGGARAVGVIIERSRP